MIEVHTYIYTTIIGIFSLRYVASSSANIFLENQQAYVLMFIYLIAELSKLSNMIFITECIIIVNNYMRHIDTSINSEQMTCVNYKMR